MARRAPDEQPPGPWSAASPGSGPHLALTFFSLSEVIRERIESVSLFYYVFYYVFYYLVMKQMAVHCSHIKIPCSYRTLQCVASPRPGTFHNFPRPSPPALSPGLRSGAVPEWRRPPDRQAQRRPLWTGTLRTFGGETILEGTRNVPGPAHTMARCSLPHSRDH